MFKVIEKSINCHKITKYFKLWEKIALIKNFAFTKRRSRTQKGSLSDDNPEKK